MNIRCVLLGYFFAALFMIGCSQKQEDKIQMVTITNPQLLKAIVDFAHDQERYIGGVEATLICRIEKKVDSFEIRMGFVEKKFLGFYIREHEEEPFGFFSHLKIQGLVVGDYSSIFFRRNSIYKPRESVWPTNIPPKPKGAPPFVYEPIVEIYSYQDNTLEMVAKGRFSIIKWRTQAHRDFP